MRGLLALGFVLVLAGFVWAGSALAQEKRITVVAPEAARAGLRGPVDEAPAPEAGAMAVLPAPAAPPAPQIDASACRTGCAQAYYFCLSGSDDQCPVRWTKCVLSCSPVAPPAT